MKPEGRKEPPHAESLSSACAQEAGCLPFPSALSMSPTLGCLLWIDQCSMSHPWPHPMVCSPLPSSSSRLLNARPLGIPGESKCALNNEGRVLGWIYWGKSKRYHKVTQPKPEKKNESKNKKGKTLEDVMNKEKEKYLKNMLLRWNIRAKINRHEQIKNKIWTG